MYWITVWKQLTVATLPRFAFLGYKNFFRPMLYINMVITPANVKRIPAKRIVDGTSACGSINSYPILIKGVALPHKAQHKSAAAATKKVFEYIFVVVLSILNLTLSTFCTVQNTCLTSYKFVYFLLLCLRI